MLVLLTTSFIALNNCGNQSGSNSEKATSEDQNGPAADFAILAGPPPGPGVATLLPATPIETQCFNGIDDDGDGMPDCMDADCSVQPECSQWGPPIPGLVNSAALTIYPNGLIAQEDVVFLGKRAFDDDNTWTRTRLFDTGDGPRNCFIDLRQSDPYYFVPMGEALIASPEGPVGPQLVPSQAINYFGPRAGLIPICNVDADYLMFPNRDDDF